MSAQDAKKNKRIIIGLTGNIASGKSTALKIIQSLGYLTIDSDQIVRNLWDDHAFVLELSNIFDVNLFSKREKKTFIQQVFTNTEIRKKLESIIHPYVFKHIEEVLYTHDETVVIDMPLLYEVHYEKHCDAVILVVVDEATQIKRLLGRGMNLDEARTRIHAQLPQHEKMLKTAYHIDGTLDLLQFEKTLKNMIKDIIQDESV